MAVDTLVCRYNKYGYCRFKDTCRNRHIDEICDDSQCVRDSCQKRHPRSCVFYQAYKRCKFGSECKYRHDLVSHAPTEEVSLLSKVDELKIAITLLRKENENLKMKLETIELKTLDIDNRLVHVEAISEYILPHAESEEQNLLLTPLQIESGIVDSESSRLRQEELCRLSTRKGPYEASLTSAFPTWSFKTP